jgi:formate hydrogenlyase subunit 6/NADH:ubiquinone oxidoreductase subunit I
MRKPKLRELREALLALVRGPYTTKYPFEPHVPPEGFRGKPQYDSEGCIGCKACAEVCPALAIKVADETGGAKPIRRLTVHYDKCIFCGQCELNCTTQEGIKLTREFELAGFDRSKFREPVELDLVVCQVCGCVVGARKHLVWVARRLGPKAYANPTLIVTAEGSISLAEGPAPVKQESLSRNDMMRVVCPDCRRTIVLREIWGE